MDVDKRAYTIGIASEIADLQPGEVPAFFIDQPVSLYEALIDVSAVLESALDELYVRNGPRSERTPL